MNLELRIFNYIDKNSAASYGYCTFVIF